MSFTCQYTIFLENQFIFLILEKGDLLSTGASNDSSVRPVTGNTPGIETEISNSILQTGTTELPKDTNSTQGKIQS